MPLHDIPIYRLEGQFRDHAVQERREAEVLRWPVSRPVPKGLRSPAAVAKASAAFASALADLRGLLEPALEAGIAMEAIPAPATSPFDADAAKRAAHERALLQGLRGAGADVEAARRQHLAGEEAASAAYLEATAEHRPVREAYDEALRRAQSAELALAEAIFDARHAWFDEIRAQVPAAASAEAEAEAAALAARTAHGQLTDALRFLRAWQHDPDEPHQERRERLRTDAGRIAVA